jgi:zinc protease
MTPRLSRVPAFPVLRPALRHVALACALAACQPAFWGAAQAAPAQAYGASATSAVARGALQQVASVEGITEYRLPNGLQVLLIPDDSKPTTTVNMTYRVGSRHENYGETGMAHLLEHLLFKGSPRHPTVWAEFNKRGLRANGTTWFDRTNYFASFAANEDNLQWYLQWQADAMVNSFIARKDLDSEMTVVRNEMEMGENNPGRILFEKTLATMYQWHNYGKSTIGARTDVEGVNIERLKAFYRTHYQPGNATLIVSGKFDPAKVKAWVGQYFGPLKASKQPRPAQYTLEAVQDGERAVTLRRVGGVPLLYAGYHIMPGPSADYAAVELLNIILADTPSGRLHKALTEKQLASAVFSFSEGLHDPGFVLLGAQLGPGQDVDAATQALVRTIESVAQQPITAEELERARAKWLKDWDVGFADPQHVGVALSEAVAQGDWRLYFLLRDRVKAMPLADVQRVATQYLVPANRTLGRYEPTTAPQRAPAPAMADVSREMQAFKPQAAAEAGESFVATPENIDARTQRITLPSGLKLALLPKATRGQAVKLTLALRHGDEPSLKGWGEAPSALAALLDKGTARMSRQQVQDRLDALQTDLSIGQSPGVIQVQLNSRRAQLPQAIELLGQLLREASLPADVLEEVRRQALAGLEAQRKEPEAVLANAIGRHGNPYPRGDVRHARTFDEIEQDWKSLTLAQVRGYRDKFLGVSHGDMAVVGDFDAAAVQAAVQKAFEGWHSPSAFQRVPEPWVAPQPTRMVLTTPDKQNAAMSVALPLALSDRHPDYAALMLANHLFGAGGDSRLWNRIREKEGLSYNVYSAVQWNQVENNSEWGAEAIFAPQNRVKVEKAFREELSRSLQDGFTAQELEAGKRSLLNFRQLARAQDARIAAGWVQNLFLGRTFADSARVDRELKALTLQQVNEAWKRHIQTQDLVMGFAGDFKGETSGTPPKP